MLAIPTGATRVSPGLRSATQVDICYVISHDVHMRLHFNYFTYPSVSSLHGVGSGPFWDVIMCVVMMMMMIMIFYSLT
jgi:hypothetical protein